MADYRLTDDKPYNREGFTGKVNTAATPASIQVPVSGIYAINVTGMTDAHLLLFRVHPVKATAETIVAASGTFQVGVNARCYLDVRPIYIDKNDWFAVFEQGGTTGLVVALTLIHQFSAGGLVG